MNYQKKIVVVIDDDPSVRSSMARLLKASGFQVEAFSSAQEFFTSKKDYGIPTCILLDVKMPGLNGLDLQEKLLSQDYCPPIVFITGHGDISMSVKAIKRGAINFLTKPFDEGELLKAIKEAFSKDVQVRAKCTEDKEILQRIKKLTPREYEVLRYIVAGFLNKQIAYALGITEKTVKVHRGQVMGKLSVTSVAELVRLTEKASIEPAKASPQGQN
jgi:FixJ family two-component response regulator